MAQALSFDQRDAVGKQNVAKFLLDPLRILATRFDEAVTEGLFEIVGRPRFSWTLKRRR